MYRLILGVAYLVLVKCEKIFDVNYCFDENFYTNFSSKTCENEINWNIVSYYSLGVESILQCSDYGIKAVGNSCASSFPIFFTNGTLEFTIYVQDTSKKSEIGIDVFGEKDVLISSYRYGESSAAFKSGWQKIYVDIPKTAKGFINIRGSAFHRDVVLIDSFRFVPDSSKKSHNEKIKRSITVQNEGDTIDEVDTATSVQVVDEIEADENKENNFWNTSTILFVAVPGIFIVTIIIVSVYYCGKISAKKNETARPPAHSSTITPSNPSTFFEDFASPSYDGVIIIPRPNYA